MALTKKAKETNQLKELIVTAEMLAEIRVLAKRIGGIENFNEAMDVWEYKGPKKRVEDIVSPEELAKIFYYDEDGNLFFRKTGKKAGFLTREYISVNFTFQDYKFFTRINKIIFCLHNGRWAKKGYAVDHINEDKADNRPCNLRESTKSENASNTSVRKSNKLGVKGVFIRYITDDSARIIAHISCNGKRYFKSMTVKPEFVEATIQILKAWRDEMGRKLHGEFFNEG
jgi:hypothetical protein